MEKNFEIQIVGKSGAKYGFPFKGDPQHLDEWEAEGFEIYEVSNSIPLWAHNLGLTRPWFWAQDTWNWLRLW